MIQITNSEFHEAYVNTPKHYAPVGYHDAINRQRMNHRFVGKFAWINGRKCECIRAEDDLVIFRLSEVSEMIVTGDKVAEIKWCK